MGSSRGAYHYFTFGTPGREQALNFIAAVPRDENALPPVVDFEFAGNSQRLPRAEMLESLKAFLDTVEDYYGQRPVLYVTKDSFAEYLEGEDLDVPHLAPRHLRRAGPRRRPALGDLAVRGQRADAGHQRPALTRML